MTCLVKPEQTQDGDMPTISNGDAVTEISKKPLSFWLSFVALNITVFIVSLDSAALAIAIPVCP